VRNIITESILRQHIQNNGYYGFTISIDGKLHSYKTARIVAETFIFNDDPINKTQVNHIDGCKFNNTIYNLEWCTPSENQKHSVDNGLRVLKNNCNYDYSTILSVCGLLQDNYSISDIEKKTSVKKKTIYDILYGNAYKDISSKFDFSKRTKTKSGPKLKYTEDTIHELCQEWNNNISCKDLSLKFNIPENTIYGIILGTKKQYEHIVSKYITDNKPKRKIIQRKYTNEQIHLVCKLLEDNLPVLEISNISGVAIGIIYKIKNREIYTNISKHYNF
jgi:transposase